MGGDVEEQVLVLGCRVLGAMGCGETEDEGERLVRVGLLGLTEEGDRVVGDQVRVVVLQRPNSHQAPEKLIAPSLKNAHRTAEIRTLW